MEPGSRGQAAAEENTKMRATTARREWAGQGAGRGADEALEEPFYRNRQKFGSQFKRKKGENTRIHGEETQSYSLAGRSSTSSFSVLAKEIS